MIREPHVDDKPEAVQRQPQALTEPQLMTMAKALAAMYQVKTISMKAFDGAFQNLEYMAMVAETALTELKRSQLYVARGIRMAGRMINGIQCRANSLASYGSAFLNQINELVKQHQELPTRRSPNIADLLGELKAIANEFPLVKVDRGLLVIHTENIVMNYKDHRFDFGPFAIMIDVKAVAAAADIPFDLKALDPHYDATHHFVHPHITGDHLCMGTGDVACRKALNDARFYDFAIMVSNILATYNPDSPYIKLNSWIPELSDEDDEDEDDENHGNCTICGERFDNDELYTCGHCDNSVCDECSEHCEATDQVLCRNCIENCDCDCDHYGCADCSAFQNYPCIVCGDVRATSETEECEHAVAYSSNGIRRIRVLCNDCGSDNATSRTPCVIMRTGPDGRVTQTNCEFFGHSECALVVHHDMDEEEEDEENEQEEQGTQTPSQGYTNAF